MASQSDLKRWQHLCDILQPERLTSIVDIGANPVEPAPYDALVRAGLAEVLAFEPQSSAYKALLANPQPNQTVLPYAVGDGKRATLHVCRHSGFTSLLKPNPEAIAYLGRWEGVTEVIETVIVDTRRLDDLAELQHVDLVKIDIQGGELSVFKNGRETLKKASAVITEVAAIPLYEKQPLLHDQMKFLHDQGFMLHKFLFFNQVSLANRFSQFLFEKLNSNQVVDGDAVFIKSLLELNQTPDEDLKQLAILSDAIFQSYDLTVSILSRLLERGVLGKEEVVLNYCRLLPNPRLRRLRQAVSRLGKPRLLVTPMKADNDKVSAVIICYNNERHIEQATRSAMSLRPRLEKIVIVDDCSTDGSYEILLKLAEEDDRIQLLQTAKNSGPGRARNKGVANVETPYFCFLDGDDFFHETASTAFQDAINEHPQADLFIFEGTALEEDGKTRRTAHVVNGIYKTPSEKITPISSSSFSWNKLYSAGLVKDNCILFPPGRYEDGPWCYECVLRATSVVCISRPIVWYRIHSESMVNKKSMHQFDAFDQWASIFEMLDADPMIENDFINHSRVNSFIHLTQLLFEKLVPDDARREFAEKIMTSFAPIQDIEDYANSHPQRELALRRIVRLNHFLQRTKA